MDTLTDVCARCKKPKDPSEFYARSGGKGHLSECKACMKARNQDHTQLPPTQPRDATEIVAIDYLKRRGVHALPGKAVKTSWCDVVAWGAVGIEIKWGCLTSSGTRIEWTFNTTPVQRKRGFVGHLVMLICDPKDGSDPTFHIFRKDDPVFYIWRDGEPEPRLKTGLTYFRGRKEALKHGDNRVVMTDAMMDMAQDNISLIWQTMAEISRQLMVPELSHS